MNKIKTIICLSGPKDKGKTTTIWKLYELLGGTNREWFPEVEDCVDFHHHKIGCMSTGDPGSSQKESLEKLLKAGCDIVVTASRTYGKTETDLYYLARKYKYKVIRVSLLYMYEKLGEPLYGLCHEENVRFVLTVIDRIVAGKTI